MARLWSVFMVCRFFHAGFRCTKVSFARSIERELGMAQRCSLRARPSQRAYPNAASNFFSWGWTRWCPRLSRSILEAVPPIAGATA